MKRLFAICLVASMLALPLAGCGGGTETDKGGDKKEEKKDDKGSENK